ncbi:RHS repeat protein [Rhodanobacter sp. FDAARGOS 1247]|uniref:RHS repeat-associated core domain-containing protein n=1 Tax=Rhodanobacter sp. FDAARGOS 1247 TaxID=2778082 RepID=UPI0019517345|nr:RHS repeat-associated core domain-containing protein [Rhodanobacter sp. FDAARGOS 1247]QRP65295.1 RHS repeat protein [Rhodanobacter sp. FDAARGOS 1247]
MTCELATKKFSFTDTQKEKPRRLFRAKTAALCAAIVVSVGVSNFIALPARAVAAANGSSNNCTADSDGSSDCSGSGSGSGSGGGGSGTQTTDYPPVTVTATEPDEVTVTAPDEPNWNFNNIFGSEESTGLISPPVIGPQGGGGLHTPMSDKPTAKKKQNRNPCPNAAGDPIMVNAGNKAISVADFAEPGEMGLRFERYYNSKFESINGNVNSSIGAWTTNIDFTLFNVKCVSNAGSSGPANLCAPVRLYRPDGSYLDFSLVHPIYSNPSGAPFQMVGPFTPVGTATLNYNTNGTYTLHDEDAKVFTYSSNGLLLSIMDPSNVGWIITHPDSNTTIVTHTNGQSIKISLISGTNTLGSSRQVNVTDPSGNVYKFSSTYSIGSAILTQTSHIGTIDSVTMPGLPGTTISYKYLPATYSPIITDSLLSEVDYNGVPHDVTTYDSSGNANMTSMADGSQKISIVYSSNSTGRVATLTNALNHSLVYQYDNSGLLLSIKGNASANCDASYASNTYDAKGNMASSTDNNGNITVYSYDANGLLLKTVEAFGTASARTTDYVWDPTPGTNRLLSIKVEGYVEKSYAYNAQNRMASVKVTDLTGIGNTPPQVTTYSYVLSPNHMVTSMVVTNPSLSNGNTVTSSYNAQGFLTTTTNGLGQSTTYGAFTALGRPGTITNANGDITYYVYDTLGRLVTKSHAHSGVTNTGHVSYDAISGRPSLIVNYDNEQTRNVYDVDFKLVSSTWTGPSGASIKTAYTYDALGDVTSATRTLIGSNTPAIGEYRDYDQLGREIAVRGNHGQKVKTTYDLDGNISLRVDALNRSTSTQYDSLNRPVAVTDANGGVTKYQYDLGGHVIRVTDPRNLVTSYAYDGFGQRWTVASPDTGATHYAYDVYGRLSSITRNSGAIVTYAYDVLNRVISESAGGQTHAFTYDSCANGEGRLCGFSDGSTSYTFTYGVEGWMSGRSATSWLGTSIDGYAYDGMGRLIQQINGPYVTTYTWTDDQVSKVNFQYGGRSVDVASNITYDASRHPTSWTYGNGMQRTQTYDSDGRITGLSSLAGAAVQQKQTYAWDDVNRITSITNNAYTSVSQNFGYDKLDRMTSQSGPAALALTYDANGNRTQQNGLTNESVAVSPASNRINQRGGHAYTYDADGNRASDVYGSSVLTYGYDAFNRLNTASRSAAVSYCETTRNCPVYPAGTTTYVVNAIGQRIQKSNPQETALYAYDQDGRLSGELSSVNGYNYYIYLNGQPIALIHNPVWTSNVDTLYYLHDDQSGRPEVITDGAAQKVWQALNYGFDRSILLGGVSGVDIGFPGQIYDAETGNWNNGFRDYDSSDGRYLESDPTGLTGGLNTYAYVGGNPLGYTDPYGLDWQLSWTISSGSVAVPGAGASANAAVGVNFPSFNPSTWSLYGTTQGAGGVGGGVFAGFGEGLNISHGDAPVTGTSSSNYAEINAGWEIAGGLSTAWDNCGKTTGVQGAVGVWSGGGWGVGGFIGKAWSATYALPSFGNW